MDTLDKFLTYLGGLVGGYAMVEVPVGGTVLSGLDPVLNLLGSAAMVVFAGAFIVSGVRYLIKK